jgi:hypothetical protein
MSENGTCDSSPDLSVTGYIPNLNNTEMCGFNSDWDLPSAAQLRTMSAYVSHVPKTQKGTWFNEHGFSGIQNNGLYLGQCTNANCALPSGTSGGAWLILMSFGDVLGSKQNFSFSNTYGWGVHFTRP